MSAPSDPSVRYAFDHPFGVATVRAPCVVAPSVIGAARALRFRLWLGAHYYGKGK